MTFVMPESRGISLPKFPFHLYTFQYKHVALEEWIPSRDDHAGRNRQVVAPNCPCDHGASCVERNTRMIDGLPLSFFLPLVVHALAGITAGITGVVTFSMPKRPGRHHRWGTRYLWAYTVVFLTAIILSVQHWPADAYLFGLATLGYALALGAYTARRFRQDPRVRRLVGRQWVVVHILGMIGSYTVLWTAFYVDNAHLIPGLKELPLLTFWVLPTVIALPFIVLSLLRFAAKSTRVVRGEPGKEGT